MPSAALQQPVPLQQPVQERRLLRAHDPTFYPIEEKVGQDTLQMAILELLRPLVERWFMLLGKPTFVGADQFIYYKLHDPTKCVAPDIYVLPRVPVGRRIKTWKVWKTGIVPSLAIEVVATDNADKDYREAPERYAELGVDELIIFDPDHELSEDRVRWQRYRKLPRRGFVAVESTNADRLRSRVLGCFLRVVGEGDNARLRLGAGPSGDDLFPTEAEAERAAKEQALRRVAELEALLAKQDQGARKKRR
jgi:Putative restriction endonuclease